MKNLVFSSTTDTHVELKWWVFLLSALISYLTVRVSVGKATKIASKVSPIEALRFTENAGNKKKAKKHSNTFSPMRFALRNVFRDPKRCFFMVLSLALSLVILNSVYTLIHGFDEDKYVSNFIANDFSVADALTDNPAIVDQTYDGVTDTFLEALEKQEGILQIGNVYAEDSVPQYLNDRDWARLKERFLDNPDVYTDFRYGTIGTPLAFWCQWKKDTNKVGEKISEKEAYSLFFNKENFMFMFHYGVLNDGGVKKVLRPHQVYAIKAAAARMPQKESGVIWHSQGSGKSLTMVALASRSSGCVSRWSA
jgi:hypothetical protein